MDKINQRINILATNCFYTDYIENGKKSGATKIASAPSKNAKMTSKSTTSHLNLLTENEIRIQIFHQLQTLFYFKIIYSLKKVLWSFHKKLRPVIVF